MQIASVMVIWHKETFVFMRIWVTRWVTKIWSTISKLGVIFDGEERDLVKKIEFHENNSRGKQQEQKAMPKGFR